MTPQMAVLMARYNQWMNARLYEVASQLAPAQLAEPRGAFFGSILGTLNHLLVADLVWLHRFAVLPGSGAALQGLADFPRPSRLDAPLAADLAGLRSLRGALDALILDWVAVLEPAHMELPLAYANLAGVPARRPFGALLQHFFNHQTHHRGQATTLLSQCGLDVGVTDLLALIPALDG